MATITQLHLKGSKATLALAAHAKVAQEAASAGKPAPSAKAIHWAGFSGRGVRVRDLGP